MPRNVEIKARISDFGALLARAKAIVDSGPTELYQDDTFFACPNGRLKLRVASPGEGELIFYKRPDTAGPKESFYLVVPTSSPDKLRELLSVGYGVIGRIRKRRVLFLTGRTRIHLDQVEGLGDFLELEVVLKEDEPTDAGAAVARELMDKLGILPEQLVTGAYVDLLSP
jgi:predicted adenylyl cyclase CyaB